MSELFIPLWYTSDAEAVYLTKLNGHDELLIEDRSTRSLIEMLDALMSRSAKNNIKASKIVTADRDRMLAFLYISMYGSKIECSIDCENCKEKFDLDFQLTDLLQHVQGTQFQKTIDGNYTMEPDIRFRLPDGEDEMMIHTHSTEEASTFLFERCLIEGPADIDTERVQTKMAEIAPVLNIRMEAHCPECCQVQFVVFDMQSFFMEKLIIDRQKLFSEVHRIASNYHWPHSDILNLQRELRKKYVQLIDSEN